MKLATISVLRFVIHLPLEKRCILRSLHLKHDDDEKWDGGVTRGHYIKNQLAGKVNCLTGQSRTRRSRRDDFRWSSAID